MSEFTPGPWELDSDGHVYREPWTEEADPAICKVNVHINSGVANARLIAAAPEMYNGILRIIDEHSHIKIADTPDWLDKIVRVINKVDNWP